MSVSKERSRTPRGWVIAGAAVLTASAVACKPRSGRLQALAEAPDGAPMLAVEGALGQPADIALAREISAGRPFDDPGALRGLAASLARGAEREGAGARAAELLTLASRVEERLWRRTGDARDGADAVRHAKAASGALARAMLGVDCDEVLRSARLAGDLARDLSVTYAELTRAEARLGPQDVESGACRNEVDVVLQGLRPYRPDERLLTLIQAEALADPAPRRNAPERPPRLIGLDAFAGRDAARVVLTFDRDVTYRVVDDEPVDASGPTTCVDIDGADLAMAGTGRLLSGIVSAVRTEPTTTGMRVSLAIDGHAYRRVFSIEEPTRLVIDVLRHARGLPGPREVSRVMLDPGHGGRDVGAIGPAGLREKDVSLDIAQRVGRALAESALEVRLTRDDDRTLKLEERTALANAFGADLFISIHCNASEGHARRGIETYVLDTSSDAVAARVAARENATSEGASQDLAAMLGRMRLVDHAVRSTRFAHLLQRATVASARTSFPETPDGGVHPAGFYVLVGAAMPGVLLETSYVTNALDEKHLGDANYRQSIADGIVNAIRAYREGR